MNQPKTQEIKLEVQLDDDVAQGVYANLAMVNHSDAEFTIDFLFLQPQAPKAKVRARVITSPRHIKRLIGALQENLRRYEEAHGKVPLGPAQPALDAGNVH